MYIIISSSDFSLPEAYKQIIDTDILARLDPLVDWNSMRLIVSSLFHNHAEKGGRTNVDEGTMIRHSFYRNCMASAMNQRKGNSQSYLLHVLPQIPV